MASNKSNNEATEFIVTSVGVCLALTGKAPCAVVAYAADKQVSFVTLALPKKNKLYTYEDFLAAIAHAEGAARATYTDKKGRQRDIYFCRAESGAATDIVARDIEGNRFVGNFAQVLSGHPKFALEKDKRMDSNWKVGQPLCVPAIVANGNKYEVDCIEYAIVNAYNACLLGLVFAQPELDIETKDGRPAKFEVRTCATADSATLCIHPVIGATGFIESYVTEEYDYYSGLDLLKLSYKIKYTDILNNYFLTRQ